jgi:antitoxin component YwqK of YwqJK toxin-antitoxin module
MQKGSWKEYHENSTLKAEGIYVNGEKEGEWKNYDDKGKSIKSTTFSKGEVK